MNPDKVAQSMNAGAAPKTGMSQAAAAAATIHGAVHPAARQPQNTSQSAMSAPSSMSAYVELTRMIERMHRRFLDVLRIQLQRAGVVDINAVQCLMLSNIGDQEINARLLMDRGYYLGSNASYNIKRLVESGYLDQRQAEHDRRSMLLRVSAKGRALCERMNAAEANFADAVRHEDLANGIEILRRVERVWDDFLPR
jgi:DNA-binding MarR family transcriptional regulator